LLTLDELFEMLEEARLKSLKLKGRKVIIRSVNTYEVKTFDSINDCLLYLNTIAVSNKTTLCRHIESGKPYNGFICQ